MSGTEELVASAITPTGLAEARAEMVVHYAQKGTSFFAACINAGLMPVRPDLPPLEAADIIARSEVMRLRTAELFWIGSEMTDLVTTAALSLPYFTLAPEDLPAPCGLVHFESPIEVYQDEVTKKRTFVTAAAWGPWMAGSNGPGGLWVSWYSDRDLTMAASDYRDTDPARWRLTKSMMPPLLYDKESVVPFAADAMTNHMDLATGKVVEGLSTQLSILRTLWMLMQQPIIESTDLMPDRAARKRMKRDGQEPQAVRVLSLKRSHSSADGSSDREFHHQWVVRGHWRQQWYPKREVHRPVWIAPHIKGPEGAPLLGGEKVYAWKR